MDHQIDRPSDCGCHRACAYDHWIDPHDHRYRGARWHSADGVWISAHYPRNILAITYRDC